MPSRTGSDPTYSCNVAIRLIDVQTIDRPVGVCESRRVVLHVVITGVREGGAAGARAPDISGPVAAEVCVQDLVVHVSVAAKAGGGWCWKGKGNWMTQMG